MHCGGCNMDYKPTFFSVVERKTIEVYRRCQLCLATGSHVPVGKPPRGERYVIVRGHAWCSSCQVWHPVDDFGRNATTAHQLNTLCRQSSIVQVKRSQEKKISASKRSDLQCGVCQSWKLPHGFHRSEASKPAHARMCRECVTSRRVIPTLPPVWGHRDTIVRNRAWCNSCQAWLLTDLFVKSADRKHGLGNVCRSCNRETWRATDPTTRYKYHVGQSYETLYTTQRGVCAICGEQETALSKDGIIKRLAVDHDHDTGYVRGLLCARCNMGIGLFKDCPNALSNAIVYLKNTSHK